MQMHEQSPFFPPMKQELDTSSLMTERNRLIDQLLQMLTELGWKPPSVE